MVKTDSELNAFDGTNLYFTCWDTDQNPKAVVCLIHGLGEHSGRYEHWGAWLNNAGYSLLAIDLRGHGKSGGQRGHVSSFNDYLNDTDTLLQEAGKRFPGIPVFLYGHSMGAIITVDYVLRRKPKIRGVVISALETRNSLQEQKAKVLMARLGGTVAPKLSISSGLIPETISRDAEVVYRYTHDPYVHDKVSLGWGKSALETIRFIKEHNTEWNVPVLIMHGEKDAIGFAEGSREFGSNISGDCTVKIWPGLFHEVHNEPEKEQVFEYLKAWLDEHV